MLPGDEAVGKLLTELSSDQGQGGTPVQMGAGHVTELYLSTSLFMHKMALMILSFLLT